MGRVALTIGGIIAAGVAVYFVAKGITRRFMCQIDRHDLGSTKKQVIEYTGAVGWVGRGLTVLIVSLFVTWAALDADPGDVRGLDSSMHRVANSAIGQAVVFVIGICLLIYASYCLISAPHRRLAWEDNPEPRPTSDNTPKVEEQDQLMKTVAI